MSQIFVNFVINLYITSLNIMDKLINFMNSKKRKPLMQFLKIMNSIAKIRRLKFLFIKYRSFKIQK